MVAGASTALAKAATIAIRYSCVRKQGVPRPNVVLVMSAARGWQGAQSAPRGLPKRDSPSNVVLWRTTRPRGGDWTCSLPERNCLVPIHRLVSVLEGFINARAKEYTAPEMTILDYQTQRCDL